MPDSNRDILLDARSDARDRFADIPASQLESLVGTAPELLREMLACPPEERVDGGLVIVSLGAAVAQALRRHDAPLFERGLEAFADCWRLGSPDAMYPLRTPDFEASLWESVVLQLYALGAVAVEEERWEATRQLTQRNPSDSLRETWLRHGQVASARSAAYPEDTIVPLASAVAGRLGVDRPQEMVCRFDLISALVISETDLRGFFPNAAELGESLVEPLVIDELRHRGSALRQCVFPGDEPGLREALANYDTTARLQAALQRRGGRDWRWRAFEDARTWVFIREGHILEEWELA